MGKRGLAVAALIALAALPARAQNYSDIWWDPFESGWGLTIADHESLAFIVWYTYDAAGKPTWFVVPSASFGTGKRVASGDLFRTTGAPFNVLPFNPNIGSSTKVGTASIDFSPAGAPVGQALLTWTVGAATQSKTIARFGYGNGFPWWGHDRTDIWWNAAESGWGITLAQHGSTVFGSWFTYDAGGNPLFIVMPSGTFDAPGRVSGELFTTAGPFYGNAVFDRAQVRSTSVGNASVTFNGGAGTFTATVNGVTQSHAITPFQFAGAAPVNPTPGIETWKMTSVPVGFLSSNVPAGVGSLIMADVLMLANGTYRMYFTGFHTDSHAADLWLAESADAASWTIRGKVLSGTANPTDQEFQLSGPSVVPLPDGRWRMYYDGSPSFDPQTGTPSFQLFSAISSDGVNFVREGVRVANSSRDPNSPFVNAGHGRVIRVGSGYELFLSGNHRPLRITQGVFRLHSDNGLDFGAAEVVSAGSHDPVIARLADGTYRMYAADSPEGAGSVEFGQVFSSADGLSWSAPRPVSYLDGYGQRLHVSGNQPAIGDFAAVVLANGTLRLFSNYNAQNLAAYDLAFAP